MTTSLTLVIVDQTKPGPGGMLGAQIVRYEDRTKAETSFGELKDTVPPCEEAHAFLLTADYGADGTVAYHLRHRRLPQRGAGPAEIRLGAEPEAVPVAKPKSWWQFWR